MRYFIELAYKGTPFCGWQIQPNAITVQEEIEKALSLLLRKPVGITGSSRTDTGVHALQQFAHFDLEDAIPHIPKLIYNLNGILRREIVIKNIYPVSNEAHSRFDAIYRRYQYRITQTKNPFFYEVSLLHRMNFDIEKMNEAAQQLLKYIDFQCFSKVKTDVATFNCKIEFAYWEQQNEFLLFNIKADRFLRGMVRAIVGTLLEVGAGKLSITDFEQIILSKDRNKAGKAVAAHGLTLMEVGYPENYFEVRSEK